MNLEVHAQKHKPFGNFIPIFSSSFLFKGPDLPDGITFNGESLPAGSSFLAIGGATNDAATQYSDKVFEYSSEEGWREMGARLEIERWGFNAVEVPDVYVIC